MINVKPTVCACAILLIAINGCDNKKSPPQGVFANIAMSPCSPTPNTSNIGGVVRVNLPVDIQVKQWKNKRDVTYLDPDRGVWVALDKNTPDPFHIDLTKLTSIYATGKYVKIRVISRDNYFRFYRDGMIDGVARGNLAPDEALCGAESSGASERAFYVMLSPDQGNGKKASTYAIGLQPANPIEPTETPILIDPKVENNG